MRRPTDWPLDTGPIRTLQDLGMITHDRPAWARNMGHDNNIYWCYTDYLNNAAIRDLAALTFEMFTVDVDMTSLGDLRIRVIDRQEQS